MIERLKPCSCAMPRKRCCAIRTNCRAAVPARADRHGLRGRAGARRRRRADDRARRDDPGADRASDRRDAAATHGTALLFITHDLRLAAHVCDKVGRHVCRRRGRMRSGARRAVARRRIPIRKSLLLAKPALTGRGACCPSLSDHMPGLRKLAGMPGCRFAPRCRGEGPSLHRDAPASAHDRRPAIGCCIAPRAAARVIAATPAIRSNCRRWPRLPSTASSRMCEASITPRAAFSACSARFDAVKHATFRIARGRIRRHRRRERQRQDPRSRRLLVGLEQPSDGTIRIDGEDVTCRARPHPSARRDTQMIFQDPQSALNPRRRVAQHGDPGARGGAAGTHAGQAAARAAEACCAIPACRPSCRALPDAILRRPAPAGQHRPRAGRTARAAVADEIVSGLDVSVQAQLLNLPARSATPSSASPSSSSRTICRWCAICARAC